MSVRSYAGAAQRAHTRGLRTRPGTRAVVVSQQKHEPVKVKHVDDLAPAERERLRPKA